MKKLKVKKGSTCMACLACVGACSEAFYKVFDPDKACLQIVEKKAVRPIACPQCGKCAEACPEGAITQNPKGVYMINKKKCTHCGKCVEVCPTGVMEKYLRKLPQSDYEDAMEYFTEYFADAGPENEQAVIKELGTPKQAAAELMRNLLDKKVDEREAMEKEEKQKEKKKTTGANVVWIAILALFAAPIGAPILISILIVLLCAALCAALLDMSVFLIAVVGVAAGLPEWAFSCWESVFCARCSAYTLQNGWDGCSCGVHVR